MIAVAVVAVVIAAVRGYAQEVPAAKPARCAELEQDLFADLKEVVKAGCTPSPAQISKLLENPVANFVSIPFQYDYVTVKGPPIGDSKAIQKLQITPTFPISLGRDWNLINRVVFPFLSVPFNKDFGNCMGMAANEILSCPGLPGALQDLYARTSVFSDVV